MNYEVEELKDLVVEEDVRDLRERTKSFSLRVIRMFGALPQKTEAQVIGKQVLRSATSVGANYREAQRARSKAEFISKIGDCLKELDETAYWFELLSQADILPALQLADLHREVDELLAIFTTISKRAKANR